jgi:ribosomal peptide maturation radical SAM protein 1
MAERGTLLISAPWASPRSPSIQIATLKASLVAAGLPAVADHFFLRVADWMGWSTYNRVPAPLLEDGEALYGALLFPDHMPTVLASNSLDDKALVVREGSRELQVPSRAFLHAFEQMQERALDELELERFSLVGFTLNFGQTLASAWLSARIKARVPDMKVVIGGAEATGRLGVSLLDVFPQFDFACTGEGEDALVALARWVAAGDETAALPDNMCRRGGEPPASPMQRQSIDDLPLPDFDEYFACLDKLGRSPLTHCDNLPVESSRGCYYSCTFCSLNLQWDGFREASAVRTAERVAELRRRYGRLDFFFVDNITPLRVEPLATALAAHGVDYRLFYEARVNLERKTWEALARAGLRVTQLGIEALSDDLLRLYRKKSTVLHNLRAMKWCYELGIVVDGNVIVGHPLAEERHLEESLRSFEYAMAFPPSLSASHYALLVGAPDFQEGLEGVAVRGNYSSYRRAYPDRVLDRLDLPRKAFARLDREPVDFAPLERAIEGWHQRYTRLQGRFGGRHPILAMQDGGDFMQIDDWRTGERRTTVLDARERALYLAMDDGPHLTTLEQRTGESRTWIEGVIRALDDELLAYAQNGRALALASRKRGAPA